MTPLGYFLSPEDLYELEAISARLEHFLAIISEQSVEDADMENSPRKPASKPISDLQIF
jgi:hypothetical protein